MDDQKIFIIIQDRDEVLKQDGGRENEAMVAGGGALNMLLWVNGGNLAKMGNQLLVRADQGFAGKLLANVKPRKQGNEES